MVKFKILVLCMLTLLSCETALAAPPMTVSEFRDHMMNAMAERQPDATFEVVNADEFSRTDAEGYVVQIYVGNFYHEYSLDPESLPIIIERYVNILSDGRTLSEGSYFLNDLVAIMRPSAMIESLPEGYPPPISKMFKGDLVFVLAVDSPDTLRFANAEDLLENAISEDDAFELAARNFRRKMGDITADDYDGIRLLNAQSGLVSGLPFLEETCGTDRPETAFYLLDRYNLLETELSRQTLNQLLGIVIRQAQAGENITSTILTCRKGEWGVIVPN